MAQKRTVTKDALIVAIPSRGAMCMETFLTVECNMVDAPPRFIATALRLGIIEARNLLVKIVKNAHKHAPIAAENFWALWLDDDCWFPAGTVTKMLAIMSKHKEIDMLVGHYGPRQAGCMPHLHRLPGKRERKTAHGKIVELEKGGLHIALHRIELLDRLPSAPFSPLPPDHIGEDFAFCKRIRDAGGRIFTPLDLPIGHVDHRDGLVYFPGCAPAQLVDMNTFVFTEKPALAIEERSYGAQLDRWFSVLDPKRTAFDIGRPFGASETDRFNDPYRTSKRWG